MADVRAIQDALDRRDVVALTRLLFPELSSLADFESEEFRFVRLPVGETGVVDGALHLIPMCDACGAPIEEDHAMVAVVRGRQAARFHEKECA